MLKEKVGLLLKIFCLLNIILSLSKLWKVGRNRSKLSKRVKWSNPTPYSFLLPAPRGSSIYHTAFSPSSLPPLGIEEGWRLSTQSDGGDDTPFIPPPSAL